MPLTLTDQISADRTLAALAARFAAAPTRPTPATAGRRGDPPPRLELAQDMRRRRKQIADAWAHGEGTITKEEGEHLVAALNDHTRAQGRAASATLLEVDGGLRVGFSGARTDHSVSLGHSTPDRVWAHWRGYIEACPPCRPMCPNCLSVNTSDCQHERRCNSCRTTWPIDGIEPRVMTDADRVRRHKRSGDRCFGPQEPQRCPAHPHVIRRVRWAWPKPGPNQRHVDLLMTAGRLEVTVPCFACEAERAPRPRGPRKPCARILGIPIGRTLRGRRG